MHLTELVERIHLLMGQILRWLREIRYQPTRLPLLALAVGHV